MHSVHVFAIFVFDTGHTNDSPCLANLGLFLPLAAARQCHHFRLLLQHGGQSLTEIHFVCGKEMYNYNIVLACECGLNQCIGLEKSCLKI